MSFLLINMAYLTKSHFLHCSPTLLSSKPMRAVATSQCFAEAVLGKGKRLAR